MKDSILQTHVVIHTSSDTTPGYRILITGGSTTDISLNKFNWPLEFCQILKEHDINATLYVAAVGGYNSGQELLKLIRDGLDFRPFIHLSYSGANDIVFPTYISIYEQAFYENEFRKKGTYWLLPNTVYFLRNMLKLNHSDVTLRPNMLVKSNDFWSRNMHIMHGVALENNYRFIGFLQPVLGCGKFNQSINGHQNELADNRKSYGSLKEAAKICSDFMVDLTAMFDTSQGSIVYIDHCHIQNPYQRVVAQNIYNSLVEKGVFK